MIAGAAKALDGESSEGQERERGGLGKNFASMLLWQVGNYLVPLATFPYLTRILGPSQFGIVGYVSALVVYGTVLTEWGFNLSGPRQVAHRRHEPGQLNDLIWSVIGAKACLCLLSVALLVLAITLDQKLAAISTAIWVGWMGVLANVCTLNWLLQGLERFPLFAGVALAGRFVTLPLTFLLVRTSSDVDVAIGIQSSASLLVALASLVVSYRQGWLGSPKVSWRAIKVQIAEGFDMFLSTASVSLFSATNAIILGAFAGPYQVGLYAAADKLKTVGNMVPAQINTVLYPRVMALLGDRKVASARSAARLTVFGACATAITTGIGMIICLTMSDVLTRFVLGEKFAGSAPILNWLCVSTLFGNLAYFIGLQVLVPFGSARYRAHSMLGAGLLNVILALLLVPRFSALGAASAYLISEIALLGGYVLWISRSPVMRGHFVQLMKA